MFINVCYNYDVFGGTLNPVQSNPAVMKKTTKTYKCHT